jgi:hypothetical protein
MVVAVECRRCSVQIALEKRSNKGMTYAIARKNTGLEQAEFVNAATLPAVFCRSAAQAR